MNSFGYFFNFPDTVSGNFQYPVSGRISGHSNPVFGRIPDIKKGRISGASLLKTDTEDTVAWLLLPPLPLFPPQ
jgi:hypothetical protein